MILTYLALCGLALVAGYTLGALTYSAENFHPTRSKVAETSDHDPREGR